MIEFLVILAIILSAPILILAGALFLAAIGFMVEGVIWFWCGILGIKFESKTFGPW